MTNGADASLELVERVMQEGIPERGRAARALHATLQVLGERLTSEEGAALAAALPRELAATVGGAGYDGDFDAAELYERVRRKEGMGPGPAREDAQVVLRVVGEALPPDARARVARALPREIADLLEARAIGEPPPHVDAAHGPPLTTLASGRPGSRHPLSESAPPGAQSHSVAREGNPHGDTKLSSARGTTQERLRESLATGRGPSPDRPISEAHDEEPS